MTAGSLEDRIQALEDREAIKDLIYQYAYAVQQGKIEVFLTLFTDDAVLEYGAMGFYEGTAGLERFFRDVCLSPVLTFACPLLHNHLIKPDGEKASGICTLEIRAVYHGESYVAAGRYEDEYVKKDGTWKFKRRAFEVYYMVPHSEGWAQDDALKGWARAGE